MTNGEALLSDHHVHLLFSVAFPVVKLDKPSPHFVSGGPEYHLGPVALYRKDEADDVYVSAGTTARATLIWGKEDATAPLMEVLTPWRKHHVLAAHAPQINIGIEPYVRWWAGIWREVTFIVDPRPFWW